LFSKKTSGGSVGEFETVGPAEISPFRHSRTRLDGHLRYIRRAPSFRPFPISRFAAEKPNRNVFLENRGRLENAYVTTRRYCFEFVDSRLARRTRRRFEIVTRYTCDTRTDFDAGGQWDYEWARIISRRSPPSFTFGVYSTAKARNAFIHLFKSERVIYVRARTRVHDVGVFFFFDITLVCSCVSLYTCHTSAGVVHGGL